MRRTEVLPERCAKESFTALLRRESVFAISEICKGLVILSVGDMAIADQFGDAVVILCQTCGVYGLASLHVKSEREGRAVSLAIERAWAARQ